MTYNAADGAANGYCVDRLHDGAEHALWEALNAKTVRAMIANYQSMFGVDPTTGAVKADTIAGQIKLTRDAGMSNPINMLNVWSAVTDMASVIPGIGPLMTFSSGTLSLASDLLPNSSTGPDISTQIEISADNAADELTTEYQAASLAMNSYGDYIVEDPAKLLEFGDLFKGPLGMSSDQVTDYQSAGEYGARQFLWGAILAGSYAEWAAPTSAKFSTNPKCSRDTGSWLHPFENMDATGRWTGVKPGDSTDTTWWIAENAPNVGAEHHDQQRHRTSLGHDRRALRADQPEAGPRRDRRGDAVLRARLPAVPDGAGVEPGHRHQRVRRRHVSH